MAFQNLISYFKDCYQADTRTLTLYNFFSAKVENKLVMGDKDMLLNGEIPFYPLTDDYAEEVEKNLALYKSEKVFYCAAFFVLGQMDSTLRKDGKICAPVFLYPTTIVEENGMKYAQPDFTKRTVNINFLNTIKKEGVEDLYEALVNVAPKLDDYGTVGKIKRGLEKKLEDFDATDVLLYPELYNEKKIKKLLQPKSLAAYDGYKLVPSLAFGVLRRSTATQGVISELGEMVKLNDYSKPIRYLLDRNFNPSKLSKPKNGYVPTVLSSAQKEVVKSASKNICSVVIGPPGTGKSYTIAALAIDCLSKGESVLIASRTDQAVDVIYKKIEKDLAIEGVAVRAGKSEYKKELKEHLNDLLTKNRKLYESDLDLDWVKDEITRTERALKRNKKQFKKQVGNEFEWAKYLADNFDDPGFLKKLKIKYIKWRNGLQAPHWELSKRIVGDIKEHIDNSRDYVREYFNKTVNHSLYYHRTMFRDFMKALRARNSSRKETIFGKVDLTMMLRTFPVWLVNLSDVQTALPLEKELFDLAIIDEATQCDIAGCLPIIQRAKRVVIVGDPKQLRHMSFLSQSMLRSLRKKHGIDEEEVDIPLDYRNASMLDLAFDRLENQEQISFLDEHFRSKPEIIAFSNEHFYEGNLRIMTTEPGKDDIKRLVVQKTNGKRDARGVNKVEADAVLEKVNKIVEEQKGLSYNTCQSIGILSPFSDQVEHLSSRLLKSVRLQDIEKHDIAVGTAYSFQGSERDIMLLSMAIDDGSHHSAILHINKSDVFNVSVTRARSVQIMFKSFSDNLHPGEYLSKYIQKAESVYPATTKDNGPMVRDVFLEEVSERLHKKGITTWTSHSVAGLLVDLVIKYEDKYFGVDLIGYPGSYVGALTPDDYEILGRAGLPVFPLPYTYWTFDQKGCFVEMMRFFEKGK